MAFVEIKNLGVKYGKFVAVKDLSFNIEKGSVFGFIGPNGAGKSTTIKVLATLIKPSSGTATIDGMDVTKHTQDIRRRIGYVPDFFGVYEDLTVNEYLHFFAAAYRIPRTDRDSIIDDVLALTDLTVKKDAGVDGLSRGMKQRLGLARVLLHDPDLLLLDEPASGLDPRARIDMRELLKELTKLGKTIIISSHILSELAELATQIGIIEAGELIAEGNLNDIFKQLSVRRIVHVQLSNVNDDLISKIKGISGAYQVDVMADRLGVHIKEEELAIEDLLQRIQQLGGRVRMFQPDAMDMETVFIKLTKGKLA
ncbi:MAG: ABC transporter ATP-binding protein [Verrucomicrobiota bacterium]|nr:ABC transporter ATP-binding protein [Verrucomicrobiota bacterium]